MSLKSLFGKFVKNYGDDAARLATNYGDDTLQAVNRLDDIPKLNKSTNAASSEYTFDFTNPFGQVVSADYKKPGVWNIDGKTFHDLPEGYLLTNQAVLKDELLSKRTGRGYGIPRDGTDVSFLGDAVQRFDYNNREMFERGPGFTVNLPGLIPSEDLVLDRTTLRPHKNTALGRWYGERIPSIDPYRKNPPLRKLPTFLNAADYDEFVKHLDTEDMLQRVKDATYGNIPGVSDADALAYVAEMPNLSYVDPKTLEHLHNSLSRSYDSSKKLQNLFGSAPSTFLSNAEYENALQELFNALNKLPF